MIERAHRIQFAAGNAQSQQRNLFFNFLDLKIEPLNILAKSGLYPMILKKSPTQNFHTSALQLTYSTHRRETRGWARLEVMRF